MFQITNSRLRSAKTFQLREWFVAEWGRIDSFEGSIDGLKIPVPILALKGDGLVGGLAFTGASTPEGNAKGLWINAVLVAPKYRGLGIATQLIKKAEIEASNSQFFAIYVLTDISSLYQKHDWEIVKISPKGTVLKKNLCNDQ